jgi:hypothetical protein
LTKAGGRGTLELRQPPLQQKRDYVMNRFFRSGMFAALIQLGIIATAQAQNPLESWGLRSVPGLSANLNDVKFGNGVFVAVGDQSTIARSTNGTDWTVDASGGFGDLKRVRFLNGRFLAVGSSNKLLSSTDGVTWQMTTLPLSGFWDIAEGAGVLVLAGASTYISTNQIDWIQVHPMHTNFSLPSFETPLDTVVYGNGVFIAIPTGGRTPRTSVDRHSLFSTNGIDWGHGVFGIRDPAGTAVPGTADLIIADGRVVAGTPASSSREDGTKVSISTNNGVNWSNVIESVSLLTGQALAFGQGTYLLMSQYNNNNLVSLKPVVFTSTNCIEWYLVFYDTNLTGRILGAAFGNGTFVGVGLNGFILQSGNVAGLPTIIAQPADRAAVVGNPASFSVQAAGAPPIVFQWYHDAALIQNATNSSFTISNTTASDGGGYGVVISNSFGSVTSRVAQLSVAFLDIKSYAGITVLGTTGRTYRIDATPANGALNWQTLTNLVLPRNPFVWIDYDSPSVPARLYRAAEMP